MVKADYHVYTYRKVVTDCCIYICLTSLYLSWSHECLNMEVLVVLEYYVTLRTILPSYSI